MGSRMGGFSCRRLTQKKLNNLKAVAWPGYVQRVTKGVFQSGVFRGWSGSAAWWTFRIFFIFLLVGEGEGGARGAGGGGAVGFLLKIPGGGGFQEGEGPGGCRQIGYFWGGGGGAKFFFFRPKRPPRQGQKAPKCLKTVVFSGIPYPSKEEEHLCCKPSQKSEKHRLENTV